LPGLNPPSKQNQPAFSGAQAAVRPSFLLTAEGAEPLARAEFLCGVFGKSGQTKDSAVFVLPNLPPGKYGVTILDIHGGKTPMTLTLVLQQVGTDWKTGGLFTPPPRKRQDTMPHGSSNEPATSRCQISESQRLACITVRRSLSAPVDFMSTLATDKLYDEAQAIQTPDVPMNGNAVDISAGGKNLSFDRNLSAGRGRRF
jgi:hypothetical protein